MLLPRKEPSVCSGIKGVLTPKTVVQPAANNAMSDNECTLTSILYLYHEVPLRKSLLYFMFPQTTITNFSTFNFYHIQIQTSMSIQFPDDRKLILYSDESCEKAGCDDLERIL